MKARLQPLTGKYYGTRIDTDFGTIDVWLSGDMPWTREPSAREKAEWPIPSAENGSLEDIRSDMMCGGHYETQLSFDVATVIVDAINRELDQY